MLQGDAGRLSLLSLALDYWVSSWGDKTVCSGVGCSKDVSKQLGVHTTHLGWGRKPQLVLSR